MAVKPENQFIAGVHKHLPSVRILHREKMNNPYRGGTADLWYSAKVSDLWVEYKFLPRVPQRGIIDAARINLSSLQQEWLRGRHEEGRNVGVIVGCPAGGVVLRDLAWEEGISVGAFVEQMLTRQKLAQWIMQQVLGTQA